MCQQWLPWVPFLSLPFRFRHKKGHLYRALLHNISTYNLDSSCHKGCMIQPLQRPKHKLIKISKERQSTYVIIKKLPISTLLICACLRLSHLAAIQKLSLSMLYCMHRTNVFIIKTKTVFSCRWKIPVKIFCGSPPPLLDCSCTAMDYIVRPWKW